MRRTHPQDDGNNNDHKHQDPTKTRWFHQELSAPNNSSSRKMMSLLQIVVVVVVVVPTPSVAFTNPVTIRSTSKSGMDGH
jgi:hypothetical protein